MLRVLILGDIFGQPGRRALERLLPVLKARHRPDLVVANGENASGGLGLAAREANAIFAAGVDVITSGNHIWRHRDLLPLLDSEPHLLRPHNYPPGAKGHGWVVAKSAPGIPVAVVSLMGRVFMSDPLDCPFQSLEALLAGPLANQALVIVDFHAEATSEKLALARCFDGRVSVLVGTHTHVPTADAQVLPGGTAYVTDLGMTGPHQSVIGMNQDNSIAYFTQGVPLRMSVAEGQVKVQGVMVDLDEQTGQALAMVRVEEELD